MRLLTVIPLLLFCLPVCAQFEGMIVNEFSQGDQGSREFIELLVVGHRTCTDSTADIRGWIVDDQNGWYGASNISDGHYRFKNIALWSAVPYGSIILLYNSASGQKNLSIVLPDDPTDANKDLTYVLPINSSAYLEEHDREPDNASPNPAYNYPATNSTAGYNGTSNLWVQHIALNNTGGDVLTVVSRAKRDSAFFSIGYGYTIAAGYRSPSVSIADVGLATNAWLSDSLYTNAAKWIISAVSANETPGLPNGGVNTGWIQALRTTPKAARTYVTVCNNGPYIFLGSTFTNSGLYTVLSNNAVGCVDTSDVYLVIKRVEAKDTAACDSLMYKGTKYTADATVADTVLSAVTTCDSILRTTTITINKKSFSTTKACVGAGQNYLFNGQTFTASGLYDVTLVNAKGCDSVARLLLSKTTTDSIELTSCKSISYNNQTFTSSTVLYDTLRSTALGCDSIIRKVKIFITPTPSSFLKACAAEGTAYHYNGTDIFLPGLYSFTYQTAAGCDSVVSLYLIFQKTVTATTAGCDSVWFQNRWHYNSLVLQDTIKSVVTNCDSVVRIHRLIVNKSRLTTVSACLPAGSTYVFFGQTLTSGGTYFHVLKTLAGCDSLIQLQLTVLRRQMQTITGCDSVRLRGQTFYTSATLLDTLRSQDGCDSLVVIDSIVVRQTPRTYFNVCLGPGQSYFFNGKLLTTSGNYTAMFRGLHCDSIVQLNLLIAQQQALTYRSCKPYFYHGILYTASATLKDTLRSMVTGCDSVLQSVQIIIQPVITIQLTVCLAQGGGYVFNGQTLTTSGNYSAAYRTNAGCDSVVNLQLTISREEREEIAGCERVVYKGRTYTASVLLSDTVRTLLTGCDSVVRRVAILVHPRPLLTVSNDTTVCLGDTVILTASSPGAAVTWPGWSATNTVILSPTISTSFLVTAVDTNGCRSSRSVNVNVQDFSLRLFVNSSPVLSGTSVTVTSLANFPYTMNSWQPAIFFSNQTWKSQQLYLDTSITVSAIAQTALGCTDTAWLQLVALPLDDVYIPSGFTPNADGRNDEVRITGTGIKSLDFKIFNRWGQLVFSTTDSRRGWDGRFEGLAQPAGIYIYVARIRKVNGQVVEKKGTIVLLK